MSSISISLNDEEFALYNTLLLDSDIVSAQFNENSKNYELAQLVKAYFRSLKVNMSDQDRNRMLQDLTEVNLSGKVVEQKRFAILFTNTLLKHTSKNAVCKDTHKEEEETKEKYVFSAEQESAIKYLQQEFPKLQWENIDNETYRKLADTLLKKTEKTNNEVFSILFEACKFGKTGTYFYRMQAYQYFNVNFTERFAKWLSQINNNSQSANTTTGTTTINNNEQYDGYDELSNNDVLSQTQDSDQNENDSLCTNFDHLEMKE